MFRRTRRWLSCSMLFACACGGDGGGGDGAAPPEGEPSLDPAGVAASADLSDEFDDPSTLSRWRVWHEVAGIAARHDRLDIAQSNPGMLTVRPRAGGWYAGNEGPLVYTMVQGDFLVETWVSARGIGNPDAAPTKAFNSAGLLARDPVHGEGRANWIMYNVGFQDGRVATEGKTTVNSQSTLEITEGGHQGRLRICRRGATFILARQLDGEAGFTETQRFERTDLPADLQVGVVATGWNSTDPQPDTSQAPDIEGVFDYIRFSVPGSEADCTAS